VTGRTGSASTASASRQARDQAIAAERAAAARRQSCPRDPGGVWRARLAELPGGAGGALIDEWEARADARWMDNTPRADAERLAYEDIAALRRPEAA
jgi:hypothetical protein